LLIDAVDCLEGTTAGGHQDPNHLTESRLNCVLAQILAGTLNTKYMMIA
jgi:hypothetical protein